MITKKNCLYFIEFSFLNPRANIFNFFRYPSTEQTRSDSTKNLPATLETAVNVASQEFFKLFAFLHNGGKTDALLYIITVRLATPRPSRSSTQPKPRENRPNSMSKRCRWRFSAHVICATRKQQINTINTINEKSLLYWKIRYAMMPRAVTIEQLSRCVFFSLEIYGKKLRANERFNCARRNGRSKRVKNGVTFHFRTRVRSNHIYHFLKTLFEHSVDRRHVIRSKRYISGKTKTVVTKIYTVHVTVSATAEILWGGPGRWRKKNTPSTYFLYDNYINTLTRFA